MLQWISLYIYHFAIISLGKMPESRIAGIKGKPLIDMPKILMDYSHPSPKSQQFQHLFLHNPQAYCHPYEFLPIYYKYWVVVLNCIFCIMSSSFCFICLKVFNINVTSECYGFPYQRRCQLHHTETLNITMHVNFWAILVKFRFWFSRSGLGLEILHF